MTKPKYPTAGGRYVEENGERRLVEPSHTPANAAAETAVDTPAAESGDVAETKPRKRGAKE